MHGFQSGLSDIVVQVLRALFSCPIKYHSIASTSKYYLPNDSWSGVITPCKEALEGVL